MSFFFHEKTDKTRKYSKFTILVWYENGRRRLFGAQSINTERASLILPIWHKGNVWVVLGDLIVWHTLIPETNHLPTSPCHTTHNYSKYERRRLSFIINGHKRVEWTETFKAKILKPNTFEFMKCLSLLHALTLHHILTGKTLGDVVTCTSFCLASISACLAFSNSSLSIAASLALQQH